MPTPNSYRVQKRQWTKWSEAARTVFNDVYCVMAYNQGLFLHPSAKKASDEQWITTAWNAAWTAADAVMDCVPAKGALVLDIDKKGREVRRHTVQ